MSVSSTTRLAGPFACNGVTVAFPFTFKVFQASDLQVVRTDLSLIETTLVLTTDYTVALNSDQNASPGGTVTLLVAPATGFLVTLTSNVPALQALALQNFGGFYAPALNDAYDKLTILCQQLILLYSRTFKVGISTSQTPDQYMATLAAQSAAATAAAAAAATSATSAGQSAPSIGANMASASTVDLSTSTGSRVDITGTVTINSFGTAAVIGSVRTLRFQGALTLTHSATLILPLAQSLLTKAGDIIQVQKEVAAGSDGWRVLWLQRDGDGAALNAYVQFPAIFDNGSTPGATPTIDPTKGSRQKIVLNAVVTTFTITAPPNNLPTGIQIDITQDGTGSRTWPAGGPASSKWPAGSDKALSLAASTRDRLIADWDGTAWVCQLLKGIA